MDVVVPFVAAYVGVAIGLGTMSLWAFGIVMVTSWVRGRLTQRTWLMLHRLSLPALMDQGVLPRSYSVILWIFNAFQFGGLAVISLIGLWMLRRAWRRANAVSAA
ncbi:MAG: hypothetical protein M3P16_10450 [Chloroflexota bacterium]|nr:hypothetical protein [Chloroflexota bacterium]